MTEEKRREDTGSARDDFAVIGRVNAGDKEAFRELVMRYKDMIYSIVIRQVGDAAAAEDLTQEIFVKAFVNLKTFRFHSKFSTWLTRIALNHTNSYFKSKNFKRQQRTDQFEPATHSPVVGDASADDEKKSLMRSFSDALSKIKPKFREVISLCGLEGKSYEEAAKILDIPVGTVRSRLNHARHALKDLM